MSKSQFKDYLNNNVNLITILGIFNGLSIYSSTLEDFLGKYLLGFVFTVISILVLRELIINVPKGEGLNFPIITFIFGLGSVWLFLIYLLFKNYTEISNVLFSISTMFVMLFIAIKIINTKWSKKIKKRFPKLHTVFTLILLSISFGIGLIIFKNSIEIIQSLFEEIPKKKIIYK